MISSAAHANFHLRKPRDVFLIHVKDLVVMDQQNNYKDQKHLCFTDLCFLPLSMISVTHLSIPGGLFHVEVDMRILSKDHLEGQYFTTNNRKGICKWLLPEFVFLPSLEKSDCRRS